MSSLVRVGVIGTSWWDENFHLPGLKSHPGADLVAICGRNKVRADEVAGKFEIPQVFTDYRKMIADAGLDAIVIASPDDLHNHMAMDALDARLHMICEKPLALTADHARQMYEKAEAAGVTHMTYFTFRGLPVMQRAENCLMKATRAASIHANSTSSSVEILIQAIAGGLTLRAATAC